jgi:hypothetical protein
LRVAANLARAANLRANINWAQEKGRVAPALWQFSYGYEARP